MTRLGRGFLGLLRLRARSTRRGVDEQRNDQREGVIQRGAMRGSSHNRAPPQEDARSIVHREPGIPAALGSCERDANRQRRRAISAERRALQANLYSANESRLRDTRFGAGPFHEL